MKTSKQRRDQRKRAKIRAMCTLDFQIDMRNAIYTCGNNVYKDTTGFTPLGNCTNAVPNSLDALRTKVLNNYEQLKKERAQMFRKEEQQESAMRACIDTNYDSGKDYVIRRIEELAWKKHCEVSEQYTQVYPKNAKQAQEWFKEGNFHLSQSMDEDECDGMTGSLEWGKEAPDYKARDLKYKAVKDAKTDAIDTVSILTDEAARLKALKDFESFTVN